MAVGLALLAMTASACVKANKPGVAIKNLQSNIVFGINPPAAPLGPSGFDTTSDSVPDVAVPAGRALPNFDRPATQLCEPAGISAATDSATLDVAKLPEVGTYRWRQQGLIYVNGVKIPVLGVFLNRQIKNVSKVTEQTTPIGGSAINQAVVTKTFTYEVRSDRSVQGVNSGYKVDTFQVKDHPVVVNLNNGIPVAGGGIGKAVILGDPERGITLKKSELFAPNGRLIGSFAPAIGLLMLPLSVVSGENWQSVAIDPANGAVTVLDGTVTKRQSVDACGTLIDGWAVRAREYFAGTTVTDPTQTAAQLVQYDYAFATQDGGKLIYEKLGPPDINDIQLPTPPVVPGLPPIPGAPDITPAIPPLPVPLPTTRDVVEFSIAQRRPSPLLNP
jgi:hypothetical protein